MIQFEIPNNMDIELPERLNNFLEENNIDKNVINCIYTPLKIEDGIGSIRGNHYDGRYEITVEKYINIINEINKYFLNKTQILIQNDIILTDEQLKFYIDDLKITKFCVGNLQQAKNIRAILPDAEIIASITWGLTLEELNNNPEYKQILNGIILPFQYNRKLDELNKISDSDIFSYRLICNTTCSIYCNGKHHWTNENIDLDGAINNNFCPIKLHYENSRSFINPEDLFSTINPVDLKRFKTIKVWKLVDRYCPTEEILNDLYRYYFKSNINYNAYYTNYNEFMLRIKDEYSRLLKSAEFSDEDKKSIEIIQKYYLTK